MRRSLIVYLQVRERRSYVCADTTVLVTVLVSVCRHQTITVPVTGRTDGALALALTSTATKFTIPPTDGQRQSRTRTGHQH